MRLRYKRESQIINPKNDYMRQWYQFEKIGNYNIWYRSEGKDTIWQVTTNNNPPSKDSGGYYCREWLLQIKGLDKDKEKACNG